MTTLNCFSFFRECPFYKTLNNNNNNNNNNSLMLTIIV